MRSTTLAGAITPVLIVCAVAAAPDSSDPLSPIPTGAGGPAGAGWLAAVADRPPILPAMGPSGELADARTMLARLPGGGAGALAADRFECWLAGGPDAETCRAAFFALASSVGDGRPSPVRPRPVEAPLTFVSYP